MISAKQWSEAMNSPEGKAALRQLVDRTVRREMTSDWLFTAFVIVVPLLISFVSGYTLCLWMHS